MYKILQFLTKNILNCYSKINEFCKSINSENIEIQKVFFELKYIFLFVLIHLHNLL